MAQVQQSYTEAETRKLISDLAAQKDLFKIRVMRKRPSGGLEGLATLEDAKADHISAPERWLPDLAGGGNFLLQVYHDSNSMVMVGDSLPVMIDAPLLKVDPSAPERPEWAGPPTMTFPKKQAPAVNGVIPHYMMTEEQLGSPPGNTTPLRPQMTSDNPYVAAQERAQRAEMEKAELQKRYEIDAIRRDAAAAVKAAEDRNAQIQAEVRELRQSLQRQQDGGPRESAMESLGKALGPLVPLLQTFISSNNDMKLKMLEIEAKNSERNLQAIQLQAEKLDKLLVSLMTKPAIDPAIMEILTRDRKENPVVNETMTAMSGTMNMMIQSLTSAMDAGLLGGNREESGLTRAIEAIAGAAGGFFEMLAQKQQALAEQAGAAAPQLQRVDQPGLPPRPLQRPQRQPSHFMVLDKMIRAHHDPAKTAAFFLDGIARRTDTAAKFSAAGGDVEAFFKASWGAWAMSNVAQHGPYIQALHKAVMAEAKARGLLPPEQPAAGSPPPAPAEPAPVPAPQGANGVHHSGPVFEEAGDDVAPVDPTPQ